MLLDPDSALRFIEGYKRVLSEIQRQFPADPGGERIAVLAAAREKLKHDPALLEKAASVLEAAGQAVDPDILQALRSMKLERWVYLRNTMRHAIFIDQKAENAYAVLALTNPIDEIVGGAAVVFETAVMEFEGRYICDGIIRSPVFLGSGYRRSFNEALAEIKSNGRFHALPGKPAPAKETARRKTKKSAIRIQEIDHVVLRVVDARRMLVFYRDVLGCRVVRRNDKIGLLQLEAGRSLIDLVPVQGELGRKGGAAPGPDAHNVDHFCVRVEPFDEAAIRTHLARFGVEAGPLESRFGAQGLGPSIYLSDPENNTVELKGPPWPKQPGADTDARADGASAEPLT